MKSLKELADSLAPKQEDKNKALVIEVFEIVMKEGNFPAQVSIAGIYKYDVLSKIKEELDKLTPETIEKILSKVRLKLST